MVHAFNRFEEEDHVESYKCHFRLNDLTRDVCMMWPPQSLKSKDVKKIYERDMKNPHIFIFTSLIGCGKSRLVLELIERKYNKDFDYIIIICPTLR